MSQTEKLIKQLLSLPKDFTISELDTLMRRLGLRKRQRGRTSGSAIEYYDPKTRQTLKIHSPHPGKIVKRYALLSAIEFLASLDLIGREDKK